MTNSSIFPIQILRKHMTPFLLAKARVFSRKAFRKSASVLCEQLPATLSASCLAYPKIP